MITAVGNPVYDLIVTPHISTDGRVLSGCSTTMMRMPLSDSPMDGSSLPASYRC